MIFSMSHLYSFPTENYHGVKLLKNTMVHELLCFSYDVIKQILVLIPLWFPNPRGSSGMTLQTLPYWPTWYLLPQNLHKAIHVLWMI
jgi:hypothetical protein